MLVLCQDLTLHLDTLEVIVLATQFILFCPSYPPLLNLRLLRGSEVQLLCSKTRYP
jgi:hypothetical protein